MAKQKLLSPIYGLRKSLEHNLKLGKGLLLRNTKLLEDEHRWFEEHGLKGDYKEILKKRI